MIKENNEKLNEEIIKNKPIKENNNQEIKEQNKYFNEIKNKDKQIVEIKKRK